MNMQSVILMLLLIMSQGKSQERPDHSFIVWDKNLQFPGQENMTYPEGAVDIMGNVYLLTLRILLILPNF